MKRKKEKNLKKDSYYKIKKYKEIERKKKEVTKNSKRPKGIFLGKREEEYRTK
jgi:hypothetical protein